MTTISAEPILISRCIETGATLATLRLTYPRFIHAEALRHRSLSRGVASSRAIPISRMIESVLADPAMPLYWGKNQPGMQAGDELERIARETVKAIWNDAMRNAIDCASALHMTGVHKQIANRLLEPFTHTTEVVTGTAEAWQAFLALRDHPAAEPHIAHLAREVRKTLEGTRPHQIELGEWHLPFTDTHDGTTEQRVVLSIARCASVSYNTVEGFEMSRTRAEALVSKLLRANPMHASPFEHQARAAEATTHSRNFGGGWRQLRDVIESNEVWTALPWVKRLSVEAA